MRKPPESNGHFELNTRFANKTVELPLSLLRTEVCAFHLEDAGSRPTTFGLGSAFSQLVTIGPPTD